MSTGAQAGIGVGVSVAGLAILMLVGWLVSWRKRRQKDNPQSPYIDSKAELEGHGEGRPAEERATKKGLGVEGGELSEAPATIKGLYSEGNRRYELEGDWRGNELR